MTLTPKRKTCVVFDVQVSIAGLKTSGYLRQAVEADGQNVSTALEK